MFIKNQLAARSKILKDLQNFVVGDDWENIENKNLNFNPLLQYASAILFPIISSEEQDKIDIEAPSEIIEETLYSPETIQTLRSDRIEDEGRDDDYSSNVIDQSVQARQSSFGITFITKNKENIKIKFGFSTYEKKKSIDLQEIFNQTKIIDSRNMKIDILNAVQEIQINKNLKLTIRSRKKDGYVMTTAAISRIDRLILADDEQIEFHSCYFHIGLRVDCLDSHFFEIKPQIQAGKKLEAERLNLLFRNKKSFSIGSGCASNWVTENNICKSILTEFLPSYEIPQIRALESTLSYSALANIKDELSDAEYLETINNLRDDYKGWLDSQLVAAKELDDEYKNAADFNLKEAAKWLQRITKGIEYIKNDEKVRKAFRLTNHAMLIQYNRFRNLESKSFDEPLKPFKEFKNESTLLEELSTNNHNNLKGGWRPFQLAFLLGMIPDICDPNNEDNYREKVDLIWFPTGGGKTEAYLGALAFTVILRRMDLPEDAGVTSIMRYTLRLLTSDQFRRCSALICALDHIRKKSILNADLGKIPICIGLWIGGDSSPSTHKDALTRMNKAISARDKLPFTLHECPWCKTNLVDYRKPGYREISIENKKRCVIRCPDIHCDFHNEMPVHLWEESVLYEKPTLLIGTVDNFAKLVWDDRSDNKVQETFSNNAFNPPELIIQDELHLISGPLGSMVAMYENILLSLLEKNGAKPKIIGATATLSLGGNQSESLYRGRTSTIFPPQALDWGDSFFAEEKSIEEFPGRLYVGYFGSVKSSMIESAFNAALPLLQAPQIMLPVSLKDLKKGDKEIKVSWPINQKDKTKLSIYHNSEESDRKIYTEYIVEGIEPSKEEDLLVKNFIAVNLTLSEPLISDVKKNSIFYFIDSTSYKEHQAAWDPYGTLVWYFNSKRELGDMSNQQIRLVERMQTDAKTFNYGRLGPLDATKKFSRQIDNCEELTGRLDQEEIEEIKRKLDMPWTQTFQGSNKYFKGLDILFATNMISVGVDIPRLGSMLMHGQPRTTAEYIQASSRVGREHPGLVLTAYNHTKSKDRSLYETFKNYHQSVYKYVESSSITPYSKGSRDRALAAVFVGLATANGVKGPVLKSSDSKKLKITKEWILDSIRRVDPAELIESEKEIDEIIKLWENSQPDHRGKMGGSEDGTRLLGTDSEITSERTIFTAPMTMRGSDSGVQIKLRRKNGQA